MHKVVRRSLFTLVFLAFSAFMMAAPSPTSAASSSTALGLEQYGLGPNGPACFATCAEPYCCATPGGGGDEPQRVVSESP